MGMDVVWKGMLGGLVTALIVIASKRGNILPGILPLAPTFAVIALLAAAAKGDPAGFKDACLAGRAPVPAYLVFLAACLLRIDRVHYRRAIVGALGAWHAAG